jgi:thymidylate synthase (FAD)
MAIVAEIKDDPKYIVVHEHGFVGLVDHMGSDGAIVQAARVSYGKGTKTPSEDRALIRYLVRHRHTTPLEMCEVKFHIKLPIFVMRQLIRHRTANVNEYSGRYSEMTDEFYLPTNDYLQPQSLVNKQGRAGTFEDLATDPMWGSKNWMRTVFKRCFDFCYNDYLDLLERSKLAKELSRILLPVANYTECYWKMDLHNLFHFLKLRLDPHAQQEIRDFADAIYKLVCPLFPIACEAFEDYVNGSKTLSRMEVELLRIHLSPIGAHITDPESAVGYCSRDELKRYGKDMLGMTTREIDEFITYWNI